MRGFRDGRKRLSGGWDKELAKPTFGHLPTIKKSIYEEHPDTSARSEDDVQAYREAAEIKLDARFPIPRPIQSFEESCFPDVLVRKMKQEWDSPSHIQAQGWPVVLSGHDCVGVARTGSGKTAAFILPGIVHILNQDVKRRSNQPGAVVMVPTRELAQQVASVAWTFCKPVNLRVAEAFGGAARSSQEYAIKRGVDIIIATPGRLLDFVESNVVDLTHVSYLVFDEADRMLDMGFEPQIRQIADQIRPDRQTVMWSATWPREVRSLAKSYMKDFVRMTMGSEDLVANPNIDQIVRVCSPHQKLKELQNILNIIKDKEERKTLIFANTKRTADDLYYRMKNAGFPVTVMHGDKGQSHRTKTMNDFRNGYSEILIATEVAARGIDVHDVRFVINYDFPSDFDNYVHRIGRTARGNQRGTAYTIVTNADTESGISQLIDVLQKSNQTIPEELYSVCRRGQGRSRARPGSRNPRGHWGGIL